MKVIYFSYEIVKKKKSFKRKTFLGKQKTNH